MNAFPSCCGFGKKATQKGFGLWNDANGIIEVAKEGQQLALCQVVVSVCQEISCSKQVNMLNIFSRDGDAWK